MSFALEDLCMMEEYGSLEVDLLSVLLFWCQIRLPLWVGSVASSIFKELMRWNVVKLNPLGQAATNMLDF